MAQQKTDPKDRTPHKPKRETGVILIVKGAGELAGKANPTRGAGEAGAIPVGCRRL